MNTEAGEKIPFSLIIRQENKTFNLLKTFRLWGSIGNDAMSNIYLSLPDKVLCEVRKKMQLEQQKTFLATLHIDHSYREGKKSALHYLKVLGSRMELNSVTGTNHFALPVAGQCFCSCFLSLNILGSCGCHWKLDGNQ